LNLTKDPKDFTIWCKMFRNIKVFFGIIIVLAIVGTGLWINNLWNGIPSNSPSGNYIFTVKKGDTLSSFAEKLEKDGAIGNKQILSFQSRGKVMKELQLGDYQLSLPANIDSILDQINQISEKKSDAVQEAAKKPTSTVTLKEGINIDETAEILSKQGIVNKTDFLSHVQNPKNFEGTTYAFLPKPINCTYGEIKNCGKYYLEGYLYPDTYSFFKNSTAVEVTNKLLANFEAKVWKKLEKNPTPDVFYKALTMASVIEKETGRTKGGVTDKNREQINKERAQVAGVFINRMNQGVKWQSDVTASYGHGYKICQQTLEVKDCKYLDDPLTNTKYNTYIIEGYPIGPVSNPDFNNIFAALNPTSTDALFFVMDATGKTYFADTEGEHYQNIQAVTQINNDLGL
jgi:UPF0755 protein